MISFGKNDITEIFYGQLPIVAVYKGSELIWELLSNACCFPGGIWRDEMTWDDSCIWSDD